MHRKRNPDQTRARILEAAFAEIHERGFSKASVDDIAARSGVTKGALYHHFPTKQDLGYAVVEQVIAPYIEREWKGACAGTADPLASIAGCLQTKLERLDEAQIRLGCPLNNLIQEMSAIDDGFRLRLRAVVDRWTESLASALAAGQATGTVRPDLDVHVTASFLVAAIEGMAGMAKNSGSLDASRRSARGFLSYLETLRGSPSTSQAG